MTRAMLGSMPHGWISKMAALSILGGIAAAAILLVAEPLTSRLTNAKDSIAQERLLLGRLLLQARRDGAADMNAEVNTEGVAFLEGATDAERIAGLQAQMQQHAAAAGLEVMSSQAIPAQTVGLLHLIGIQAQLSGGMDALQRVLHALESGTPTLVIDQLDMTRAPPDSAGDSDRLLMRVTIVGATPVDRP